ncbi:MAG: STAS domain-containing protein [Phycisphaerae bacterium]
MPANSRLIVHMVKAVTVVTFDERTILDSLQIEKIGQELYELVDRFDRRQLVLDFSGVKFLSSQALAVLLNLRSKLQKIKGKLVICGLRAELREVFRITKLERLFEFYADEQQALNAFGVSVPS